MRALARILALFVIAVLCSAQGGLAALPISSTANQFPGTIDCSGHTDFYGGASKRHQCSARFYRAGRSVGCQILLSSTISIKNRSALSIISLSNICAVANANAPTFYWNGSGSGPMFDVETSDNILF